MYSISFLHAHFECDPFRGYINSCRAIVGAAKSLAERITKEIPELYVLGDPPASVVAFASKHQGVNVHEVGDIMSKKGWHLNALVKPAALHMAFTVRDIVFYCVKGLDDLHDENNLAPVCICCGTACRGPQGRRPRG